MWPDNSTVESKFRFDLQYLPCPVQGEWENWLRVSVSAAQAELRDQLESAIRHVAERCASDGRLFESVFSNLRELLDMVPDLDLENDQVIRGIAKRARELDQDRETVAKSPALRKSVAEEANRIASMFAPQ
jgi:hypothetical protein